MKTFLFQAYTLDDPERHDRETKYAFIYAENGMFDETEDTKLVTIEDFVDEDY